MYYFYNFLVKKISKNGDINRELFILKLNILENY